MKLRSISGRFLRNSSKRGDRSGIRGESYHSPKLQLYTPWALAASVVVWWQKPGKHIFAFRSLLLSPGFIAESSVASAGRDSVQGNGEASQVVEAVLCIAFYRVSLPGSMYLFLRGTISRNSG